MRVIAPPTVNFRQVQTVPFYLNPRFYSLQRDKDRCQEQKEQHQT